jgi:hypothetical protein
MREWIPMKTMYVRLVKALAWTMAVSIVVMVFINLHDGNPIDERTSVDVLDPQLAQRGAYLVIY